MSTVQEAIKKAEAAGAIEAPVPAAAMPAASWGWLPHLFLFFLLVVALWNYLSEREYRRQMEARLETAISDLETARADVRRVERQNREMEDLLHAELEAANGRIAKMKFDLESLRSERDAGEAALAAANNHVELLQNQNRRLHEVIQNLRSRRPSLSASGSMSWDPPAGGQAVRDTTYAALET